MQNIRRTQALSLFPPLFCYSSSFGRARSNTRVPSKALSSPYQRPHLAVRRRGWEWRGRSAPPLPRRGHRRGRQCANR